LYVPNHGQIAFNERCPWGKAQRNADCAAIMRNTMKNQNPFDRIARFSGVGLVIGAGLGLVLGVAFGDAGLGLIFGAGAGLVFAPALSMLRAESSED
jgi:hypothetical protein